MAFVTEDRRKLHFESRSQAGRTPAERGYEHLLEFRDVSLSL